MAVHDIARIEEKIDRVHAGSMEVSGQFGGIDLKTQIDAMELAKVMAIGKISIPEHLRGNVGDCWAIIMLSSEWRMSAIQVANKSYSVNGRMAFEASLLQAVVLQRAPIKGRIKVEYAGEAATRTCKVWANLRDENETVEYTSPESGKIKPKNSPLWLSDPDQQLFYFSVRALCRRHFPDVIMGIFAKDELEDNPHYGPERAKEINPKPDIAARLTKGKGKRGFDADHVERETKPTEPEAQGSAPGVPEPQASAEASAGADANGAADTIGTPAAPQSSQGSDTDGANVHANPVSAARSDSRSDPEDGRENAGERLAREPSQRGEGVAAQNSRREIAGETLDKPASGAEARAAGSVQGEGGLPSSLFHAYAEFISRDVYSDPRKVGDAHKKFFDRYIWPDDLDLQDKFKRIRAIRLRHINKEIDADQFTAQIREAVAS